VTDDLRKLPLDLEILQQVRAYRDLGRTIKYYTEQRAKVREYLVKVLDGIDTGTFNGYQVVTVVRTRPKRFDSTAFADAHPGLYEQFRTEADEETRLIVGHDLPGDSDG
jgi:hypothetical protein